MHESARQLIVKGLSLTKLQWFTLSFWLHTERRTRSIIITRGRNLSTTHEITMNRSGFSIPNPLSFRWNCDTLHYWWHHKLPVKVTESGGKLAPEIEQGRQSYGIPGLWPGRMSQMLGVFSRTASDGYDPDLWVSEEKWLNHNTWKHLKYKRILTILSHALKTTFVAYELILLVILLYSSLISMTVF